MNRSDNMPEKQYFENIKVRRNGQSILDMDVIDADARDQLDDLEDYVASILSVELISRTDWDNLTVEQKRAKGLVAIQDRTSGYIRGEFVNGEDYPLTPYLLHSSTRNAGSTGSLEYTFLESGTYQIIGVALPGDSAFDDSKINFAFNNVTITDNVYYSAPSYDSSTGTGNGKGLVFKYAEITADFGDVIKFSNTSASNNGGMNLFVLKNVKTSDIRLDQSRTNDGRTFPINNAGIDYYIEVANTGYYNANGSTFTSVMLDNSTRMSTACSSGTWYGVTYVMLVTNYYNR